MVENACSIVLNVGFITLKTNNKSIVWIDVERKSKNISRNF